MKIVLLAISILFTITLQSQSVEADPVAKSNMSNLEFLIGNWSGTGWMMMGPGNKSEFDQTEVINYKLDSTAILIEGQGKVDGKIIHNAIAIITYDKENKAFEFRSFLQDGRKGIFKGELIEDKFYWYPSDNMRYIIWKNPEGQWYEKGEMRQGEEWFQFFEMTLDRVD